MRKVFSLILIFSICFSLIACKNNNASNIKAIKLSEGYKSEIVEYSYFTNDFTTSQINLTFKLFDEINNKNQNENIIISPVSISSVLGMLTSGADGSTLSEFETLLCQDSNQTSHSINTFFNSLPTSSKIINKNSLWVKNDDYLTVHQSFLQHNANFYNCDIFKASFNEELSGEINTWVENATNGNIKEIIGDIDEDACMYLINALTFDAEWHTSYAKEDISDGIFNTPEGAVTVKMMKSSENYYIKTNNATGFIKEYTNGDYRFVALLPNEDIDIDEYISLLKYNSLDTIINSALQEEVIATMPEFKNSFEISLNQTLKNLGINNAFNEDKADFSKLGSYMGGNLYLADVLQKTYITVDEKGTKAGAVTKAEIAAKTSLPHHIYSVTLDRPFVYAIVEAETNIPLFIGKVINF